jgi:hypothetical protein
MERVIINLSQLIFNTPSKIHVGGRHDIVSLRTVHSQPAKAVVQAGLLINAPREKLLRER